MTILKTLAILAITLQSVHAQEPFTYKPSDIPKHEIPDGLTAREYIQKIFEERHYKIKVTFRVIGEDGNPISDADINVGIDSLLHGDGYNNYKGKTNAKGLFTVESRGRGCTDVVVMKNGFYPSRPEVKWDGDLNPGGDVMHKNGGYRPWNPVVDVVLKKMGKPIPMLVRLSDGGSRSWFKLTKDEIGKDLAWDLLVGDWVAPKGKGKVADIIVTDFKTHFVDLSNYGGSLVLNLGNPDDGIIPILDIKGEESILKLPRLAPVEGYDLRKLEYTKEVNNGVSRIIPEQNPKGYFVRLRTEKNNEGKIISAFYGKITKPIVFGTGRSFSIVRFDYYLNLIPNDRNLEYDQKNNLAPEADKDLSWPP